MTETHPKTNVTKIVAASQTMIPSYPERYPLRAGHVNQNMECDNAASG